MSTKETVKPLQEYVNVPLAQLVESSTNPRKTFDEEKLEELAESIRSKGVLSPLLTRRANGHFEIVSGARRYRAAQRAGLSEVPARIADLSDEEALETQIVENVLRADVHPFADAQEKAFAHCFDGYYAANDSERSLVPASRLQAWIVQNIYLSLKSVPFSKDDETLVPEAGSCANCPKRTGFNALLFSEVREDSCADAACFNRKLDAHIAQRVTKMPNLVMISQNYNATGDTPVLARRDYVEVVTRKPTKGKDARPEQRLCDHLKPAIHTDGMEKGRLVKICANPDCKVHFGNRRKEEEQRLQFKAEKKAAHRKTKQTISFRHRLMADVLKRVKPQFGTEEMRMVACFALRSLSHELACRLAKRHGLQNPKDPRDYQMAEKARILYKKSNAAGLAVLIFEAMLLGSADRTTESKDDDPLSIAATLFKIDTKALRAVVAKEAKQKAHKKAE